jgi:hypothetical protein
MWSNSIVYEVLSLSILDGFIRRRQGPNNLDIRRHRTLVNFVRRYMAASDLPYWMSPLSYIICESVSSLSVVPCWMMAYTSCRYNELEQVDVGSVIHNTDIDITSSKGGHQRTIPNYMNLFPGIREKIHPQSLICCASYDYLCRDILRVRDDHDIDISDSCLSATHIFRHLNATWMHQSGYNLDDISYMLGHSRAETTKRYIHNIDLPFP